MDHNSSKTKPLAVISGGNGYLGSAIAVQLQNHGWQVARLARTHGEGVYMCDITVPEAVRATIEELVETYGSVRACIHAAAAAIPHERIALMNITPEAFDEQIEVAVRGAFSLARACIPHMEKDSAFIGITTSLIEPGISLPPLGSYITAKYALRGFLRTLSEESKSQGIRVYAVAPGYMPGGLNREVPDVVRKFIAAKSGAGETRVEDAASLVAELCTQTSFPPGSSITVPARATSPL